MISKIFNAMFWNMEWIGMEWRWFLFSKSQIFYIKRIFVFIEWLSSYEQNSIFWHQNNLYDNFVSV